MTPSQIHYRQLGAEESEALVLIHGLDSRGETFEPVLPPLAERFRVTVYDQRGHGRSDDSGTDYSSERLAHDLAGLLDRLRVDHCHLLGHSMGGRTAVRFAQTFPRRARSVIVEDMEMGPLRPPLNPAEREKIERDSGTLREIFAQRDYPSRDALLAALASVFGEKQALEIARKRAEDRPDGTCRLLYRPWVSALYRPQISAENLLPALGTLRMPLMLMLADPERGSEVSPEGARAFAATQPTALVKKFAGAGHSIHREQPREFVRAVLDFLAGTPRTAPTGAPRD